MAEQTLTITEDGEYARERVPTRKLLGGSYFAAGYSGEHVAGGEFVVGAAFAAWGASPGAVLTGLVLGNLLAVLSWALVCSPVATRARLTLYYYLERLAGKKFILFYNLINGIIFAVIAGGMITISASAIRGLTNTPQQVHWYPTSGLFVLIALFIGALTIVITIRGFRGLSQFAKLCAPWLLTIFLICGTASLPYLMAMGKAQGLSFGELFSHYVWTGRTPDGSPSFSIWHIAAFAWGLNLPLHLGMGDLSTLRFARRASYGYYSAFAAYGGHFVAWVTAGMLGATTAAMLQTTIGQLDIGGVVVPILGVAGTAAVMISSLTTAVPSLYRAGLAFQAMMPKVSVAKVTIALGVVTTLAACSPFIFLKWLDLMAYFNIAMAPVGAIITVEHFLLPKRGIAPFWREARADGHNRAAWIVWGAGVALAAVLVVSKALHLFFIFVPVWIACFFLYLFLAPKEAEKSGKSAAELHDLAYGKAETEQELETLCPTVSRLTRGASHPYFRGALLMLGLMVALSLLLYFPENPVAYGTIFKWGLALLSLAYFVFIILWSKAMQARAHKEQP